MLYLRLQLQLGGLQTGQHLAHIRELVTKEVDKPGFSWLGGGPRPAVSRQQAALLQLCADVEFRAMQHPQSGFDSSADGDGEQAFPYGLGFRVYDLGFRHELSGYPKAFIRATELHGSGRQVPFSRL